MTPKLFSELNLSEELLKAINKLGFEQASPIQAEAIPVLLEGRDIVGQSQTGSGKTAAFGIPAVERVDPAKPEVQVLVLCPTRELAVQVSEEIHKLAFFKRGLHALPIYGGQSYERQFHGLRQGAHIVIGTPGRVMDHMRRGTLRLDTVKMVVLDEADVMLNMGFREDIEVILQSVPKERQTVFFSATMPRPIRELIEKYARDPQNVRIEQKALTVPTVEQVYYEVDRRFKIELLARLIDLHDLKLGIIFCNTKRMVDDLVDHLEAAGYMADRLHGDMNQTMRDRVMNKFRKSGLEFLVATDVAARGIDVDDVQVVFNYDLPYDVEDYVHRIGRTGRAGRSGRAISFASGRELFQIRHIERYTNTRIHRGRIPTEAEVEEARENVFINRLRVLLQAGDFKRQDHVLERLLEEGFSSTDIASACLAELQSSQAASSGRATPAERPPRDSFAHEASARPPRPAPPRRERPAPREGIPARTSPPVAPSVESEPPTPTPPAPTPAIAEAQPEPAPIAEIPAEAPVVPPAVPPAPTPRPPKASPAKPSPARPPAAKPAPARPARPFRAQPPGKPQPWQRREFAPERPRPEIRRPRPPAGDFTRLHMNLGTAMGVGPGDIVGAIAGETGLPAKVVGAIDIRERHLFVDVATDHARAILSKLNRTHIRGHKVRVKTA